MKYEIVIELPAKANPGTPNHIESLLRTNQVKVISVKELDV